VDRDKTTESINEDIRESSSFIDAEKLLERNLIKINTKLEYGMSEISGVASSKNALFEKVQK
jgi:hypothetical protein